MLVGNAVAGTWALGAMRVPALRTRLLWRFTVAAQVAFFVEVALGVALMSAEEIEPPQMHVLYGASGLVAVAILYSYRQTSEWVRENEHLVYGLGGLFLMGLAIRAFFLG